MTFRRNRIVTGSGRTGREWAAKGNRRLSAQDSYSANVARLARVYEDIPSEQAHAAWVHLLPTTRSLILDMGAGSGRDAAWLAGLGHEIVAVEPAEIPPRACRFVAPTVSDFDFSCRFLSSFRRADPYRSDFRKMNKGRHLACPCGLVP